MFEQMGTFDSAFQPTGQEAASSLPRRRKSLKSQIVFWLVNLVLVAPAIVVVYLTIVADGLRNLMSVFATKLSKLPIPGIGAMAGFDGFNRIDIAAVTAMILCVTVSYIWFRVFTELSGHGRLSRQSNGNPILVWLLVGIAAILVIGDALIFYAGMSNQAAGGWTGTPQSVCIGATVVYSVGLAFLGGYHADYHTSEEV
ncbi:hypothetical protein [Planctomycetes bacterium TBK1r]|uniref:Uncharacterized protein n=1 Tax=Stieleria magnilauensis TaxID=2527963 RepID=A0ABX5XJ00_9BACT|nr:hypothetical protein TBK1r_02960 [Planctomycetes bacterium TBK1r]